LTANPPAVQALSFHIVEVDESYEVGDFNAIIIAHKDNADKIDIKLPANPHPDRRIEIKLQDNIVVNVLGNDKKIDKDTELTYQVRGRPLH
jgi:hypothetical protein